MTERLLIVSNRLPVTATVEHGEIALTSSSGGLATGMRGASHGRDTLWVGWPGDIPRLDAPRQRKLDQRLAEQSLLPVYLNRREVRGFYEDMSNGVLWPLFHSQVEQLALELRGWQDYVRVNERFAQVVADAYRPGDLIWVHDYQLLLLPRMLRARLPDACIGFFLHIPFPPSEIFSALPWREEILEGLLGADLIGFHTPGYLHHFSTALQRLLGLIVEVDRVPCNAREVRLGTFPMGIDAAAWDERARDPDVLREVEDLRNDAGGRSLLLGVDRLDYTKGILRRCLVVDRLLSDEASLRDQLRFIQVTVPSRQRVEAYTGLRRRVDELVGRINAAHTTASSVPIHRIHQSISERELSVLYRATDVMLVTPLRDGMNLVAKEFVASRADEDGVLVLSEFAGAASELGEALHVNPYDLDGTARAVRRALAMPRDERRLRMRALRDRVLSHDAAAWSGSFVDQLSSAGRRARVSASARSPGLVQLADVVRRLRRDRQLLLLLDYDGTLVPFADTPGDAKPDAQLLALLRRLSARPETEVHLVSGRTRSSMDGWFGTMRIGLHAEHGLWSRPPGSGDWRMTRSVQSDWKDLVRPVLDHFTATTHGTFVEEKTVGLAWHYRAATADHTNGANFGDVQARELRLLLSDLLSNSPVEVLAGNKVVEVRPQGVNKGSIVPGILATVRGPYAIIAIGDDRTDEDLFGALPEGSLTAHVGDGNTTALYRLAGIDDVRKLLAEIAE